MSSFGPTAYNIDINQLGTSQLPRFSITQPTPYQDGLVVDVVLNEVHPLYAPDGSNVGMIQVRFIPGDRNIPKENLNWASPLDSSIREYPLKNELVLIFYSLGRLFYTRRINSTNKVTESSWPGLEDRFSSAVPSENTSDSIRIASQGGTPYRPWGQKQTFSLGDDFAENPSVRMVRPNEGDLIIQGRFGNIVRFGSSLFSNPTSSVPQPNLLLTVGQNPTSITSTDINKDGTLETVVRGTYGLTYEDINKDKSSIWMVTDEEVVLDPATLNSISHLRSSDTSRSNRYLGAQIFINSDRVILNSKSNEISLFAKAEINLSAVQSITIDSAKSVLITAEKDLEFTTKEDILFTGKSFSVNVINDISQEASGNYTIWGKKIFIGSRGVESQPMVLGGYLARWLGSLVQSMSVELLSAFVISNPVALATFKAKIELLQKQLGNDEKEAIFNSKSNFTSENN